MIGDTQEADINRPRLYGMQSIRLTEQPSTTPQTVYRPSRDYLNFFNDQSNHWSIIRRILFILRKMPL